MPFAAGLEYARALGLKSQKQWELWSKSGARPAAVPSHPDRTYAESGWEGWRHWLGTEDELGPTPLEKRGGWMPFAAGLEYARAQTASTRSS